MFHKLDFQKLVGKDSKNDPRLLDFLSQDPDQSDFAIVGYPDDEGIKNNGGRLGARNAPDTIRKYFYKMRPSIFQNFENPQIYDFGNLDLKADLPQRHAQAVKFFERILDQGKTVLSFGGGHDYGYVDGKAFLNFCSDSTKKPLIVNFDAHLDVRNLEKGITSGTPFYRLLEEDTFDFIEIAIQEQCNTKKHVEYVQEKGGHIIFLNDLYTEDRLDFRKFEAQMKKINIEDTTCFLSVDIDAFSNSYAPGCSQSFATGLTPEFFFLMMEHFVTNYYVRSMGLYEVSPDLDFDDKTSKLAALIAYKFLNLKQNLISKSSLKK